MNPSKLEYDSFEMERNLSVLKFCLSFDANKILYILEAERILHFQSFLFS